MKSVLLSGIVLALGLCQAAGGQEPPTRSGEFSCAAFPAPIQESDLVERFGEDQVIADSVTGSDDGPFIGTVVHPETPAARIEVAWRGVGAGRTASWLRVQYHGSGWASAEGVRIGDTLLDVEEANGWPFRMSGFVQAGWGGGVTSWGEGRFSSDTLESCRAVIIFQPPYDGSTPSWAMRQAAHLRDVSSGHPAMQAINPRVVAIWLLYRQGAG